jgi:hypothetical protein
MDEPVERASESVGLRHQFSAPYRLLSSVRYACELHKSTVQAETATPHEQPTGKSAVFHVMRPISECRDGLAFCVACVERQAGIAEQIALLLADVYGMSDQESAGRLQIPLAGFGRILGEARNRMNRYAGGRCALVGISPGDAPDGPATAGAPGAEPSTDSEAKRAEPVRWTVDEERSRALRRELLSGLGL